MSTLRPTELTVFMFLVQTCFLIENVSSVVTLESDNLKSIRVVEGGSVVFNCTISGRQNPNERVYWDIDWTPDNDLEGKLFFAEETRTITDENELNLENFVPGNHGTYSFEYVRTGTGTDITDIHMCLLRISGVTFDDVGEYECKYYSEDHGIYINLGTKATLFVMPDTGLPPVPEETTQITPPASTFPSGSSSSNTAAIAASVTVVLFLIIIIIASIFAVYRYRLYKKDQETEKQIPIELPKVESGRNSYGGMAVNNSSHNNENRIITNDVPGVRLPPRMENNPDEPPSYSSLSRPDEAIRDQLGNPTYHMPPDAEPSAFNPDYVITTIGSSEEPRLPPKSTPGKGGNSGSVKITPSTTPGYEHVETNFIPPIPSRSTSSRTPNDSIYLKPASLAYYEEGAGGSYEHVNPDAQL